MNIKKWKAYASLAISVGLIAMMQFGYAQSYPNKPVTIVVTYAPGGLGDILARRIAERLTTKTQQTFVVENKPGATGALGTKYVIKSKADGYTLLLGQTGEITINPIANKELGYDSREELVPISLVGEVPLIMVAPPNTPYKNLNEFLQAAKNKPKELTYASSGVATPGHLAAAYLADTVKVDMVHAPYKGAGPAMTDLMGGHVDAFFSSAPSVIQLIETGRLKALAVSSNKRMTGLPNLHTVTEDIGKDFSFTLWGGIFAPKGTPDAITNYLNAAITEIIKDPSFRSGLEKDGVNFQTFSRNEFNQFLNQEHNKYSNILKNLSIN